MIRLAAAMHEQAAAWRRDNSDHQLMSACLPACLLVRCHLRCGLLLTLIPICTVHGMYYQPTYQPTCLGTNGELCLYVQVGAYVR